MLFMLCNRRGFFKIFFRHIKLLSRIFQRTTGIRAYRRSGILPYWISGWISYCFKSSQIFERIAGILPYRISGWISCILLDILYTAFRIAEYSNKPVSGSSILNSDQNFVLKGH
jgi:hypothetical protein